MAPRMIPRTNSVPACLTQKNAHETNHNGQTVWPSGGEDGLGWE